MNVQIDRERNGRGWKVKITWGEYRGNYVPFLNRSESYHCKSAAHMLAVIAKAIPSLVSSRSELLSLEDACEDCGAMPFEVHARDCVTRIERSLTVDS